MQWARLSELEAAGQVTVSLWRAWLWAGLVEFAPLEGRGCRFGGSFVALCRVRGRHHGYAVFISGSSCTPVSVPLQ